jgi:hypothetical protein
MARVFSSVPTRALAKALGRNITSKGASRMLDTDLGLPEAVARVRGVLLSPAAWAGLDSAPTADAAFLEKLDQRLEWQALGAGSLERDGPLEWRALQVTSEGAKWRRIHEGRLWWARTRFGGHHRAWTTGASPATSPFVSLNPEDADRARFALSRGVPAASSLRVEHGSQGVTIEFPGWLPRPEYRWLSLHAAPLAGNRGLRWEASTDSAVEITKTLSERLGLTVVAT